MRQVKLNALVAGIVIVGAALFLSRFNQGEQNLNSQGARTGSHKKLKVLKIEPPLSLIEAVESADQKQATDSARTPAAAEDLPYSQELATYSVLKKKVFLSPNEELERENLLNNTALLKGLGQRLLRSALDSKAALEQNVAIELLLDALVSGDAEVATEVLKGVVTDPQVENVSLDIQSRENLAGIKAEVLFQWSALKPSETQTLAKLLPGPVSQKIWSNVVEAQSSNVAESVDIDR